jgi:hypothetical protein
MTLLGKPGHHSIMYNSRGENLPRLRTPVSTAAVCFSHQLDGQVGWKSSMLIAQSRGRRQVPTGIGRPWSCDFPTTGIRTLCNAECWIRPATAANEIVGTWDPHELWVLHARRQTRTRPALAGRVAFRHLPTYSKLPRPRHRFQALRSG